MPKTCSPPRGSCPDGPPVRPSLHPRLVNGRFGDPALFVEALHGKGALLFDLGDLSPLAPRDLLRVTHVFVSHLHIDHFIGFDRLLRLHVGREKRIALVGPPGLIDAVHHKLGAYAWDLAHRYAADLLFEATEIGPSPRARRARFRFKAGFAREELEDREAAGGLAMSADGLEVRAALLEHHGPCLGFSLAERAHANVWKNRLDARGLATGPWLQALKAAAVAGAPGDAPIPLPGGGSAPFDTLRDLVTLSRGQKIAYVTDVADTPANRAAIAALAAGADTLFIEARFAAADADRAAERAHLTTAASGEIARAAGARRVEPFHFSPLYKSEEERMTAEVREAFAGGGGGTGGGGRSGGA